MGVVFKLDPAGIETVLHAFSEGADGASPETLARDAFGNLYGTTSFGGANGLGNVFQIDPDGTITVLYSFTGGNDGYTPSGPPLPYRGALYGTSYYPFGVVFRLSPH